MDREGWKLIDDALGGGDPYYSVEPHEENIPEGGVRFLGITAHKNAIDAQEILNSLSGAGLIVGGRENSPNPSLRLLGINDSAIGKSDFFTLTFEDINHTA